MSDDFKRVDLMSDDEIYAMAYRNAKEKSEFYVHLAVYVLVNAMLWFTIGGDWQIWVIFGWGIGLVSHGISIFFGVSHKRVDREYERLKQKINK